MSNLALPCDVTELRSTGILLEINRLILHPLGYDMDVQVTDGDSKVVVSKTEDPDGVSYRTNDLPESVVSNIMDQAQVFHDLAEKKHAERQKHCGFVVQPLVDQVKNVPRKQQPIL